MFAKLKQKIQEEDLNKKQQVNTAKSSVVSANNAIAAVVDDADGLSRQTIPDFARETYNSPSSQVGFSISDSPTSPVRTNNGDGHDQFPSDSQRIAELFKSLDEERRLKERLQFMLEKQQDTQSRKIEEKEAEWRNKLVALEKVSTEWRKKFEETSPWKEKYIRDHEAVEELEGFQDQELAKVKHLLLISQQELQERKVVLKERDADLEALRSSCVGLNDELTHLRDTCERLEDESCRAKEKSHRDAETIEELGALNDALTGRVSDLSRQLEEKESQTGRLQGELSDLRDEHASFKHSHEAQVKRDRGLLDARDSDMEHLRSRLIALERRLADVDLGDDDRLANVCAERDALEVKLDECRQHLSEVKSTWSERIEALETQIAHLNSKMADDSQEVARCEDSNRQLRDEVGRLESELRHSRVALEFQRNDLNARIQDAQNEKQVASELFRKRIDDLEARLSSADAGRERLISSHREEYARLEESRLDELRRVENEKAELLANMNLLENRNADQDKEISQLKQKIEDLNSQMKSIRQVEDRLKEDLSALKANLKTATEDRDDLRALIERRTKEEKVTADEVRAEREQHLASVEGLRSEMDELRLILHKAENEAEEFRKKITDLEKSFDSAQTDNSNLRATIALLETQLADRNKLAKLQRQRLGDMKKTLQRELQAAGRPPIDQSSDVDQSLASSVDHNNVDGHLWSRTLSDVNSGTATSSASPASANHLNSIGRQCSSLADKLDDINFRYVKHVILKFMTSTEYEAHQLIKAIGVLLDFSRDEERLVRETLNWKTSWFGTKPQISATRSRVGNRTVI